MTKETKNKNNNMDITQPRFQSEFIYKMSVTVKKSEASVRFALNKRETPTGLGGKMLKGRRKHCHQEHISFASDLVTAWSCIQYMYIELYYLFIYICHTKLYNDKINQ